MLHAPVTEKKAENGQTQQPLTPLPERERYPLSVEASGQQSPVGNGSGSTLQSGAARYRSHAGDLQRMYGNQAVLQMRRDPGGQLPPLMPLRPSQSGLLQRKCDCGARTSSLSDTCEECSKKPLQAKLAIGASNDPLEQEADRVADQVLAAPANAAVSGASPHIQRFTGQAARQADAAPASVDGVLASPGSPLEPTLQQDMEQRFGHDFSRVRVHSGEVAEQSAREVNANAYTVGHNMVFGAGRFAPGTHEGRRLIAHELTHVVQQTGEPVRRAQPVVQRFGSQEHVRIGSNALPGQDVLIVHYGRVSYGEMIAMAGDYFESLLEMQSLALMGRFGRQQIDYARWKVNPSLPRPVVDPGVEDAVEERYTRLAARNETHFSTGSAHGRSNREQYIAAHTTAIRAAYNEGFMPLTIGLGFEAQEAFANHFLTDAFSAGHIRTPRGQIQTHWGGLYPNFSDNLVQTISCYMASYINDRDRVGYVATVDMLTNGIAPVIRQRGGSALSAFSIGDLISKVMHDADNAGLDVVSSRGPGGATTPSPYRWRAVGDEFLYPTTANTAATQTQQMVEEAVRLSFQEARQAYSAGVSANSLALANLVNPSNFRALALIPAEDIASTTNPTYNWRVSSISALPVNLRSLLVAAFAPGTEVRRRIDSLPVPRTYSYGPFNLSTGDAWDCFKRLLLADPFGMIERICNGNTCPPGQNNPCP